MAYRESEPFSKWKRFHFGKLTQVEITLCICNEGWQYLRRQLKGQSLDAKRKLLAHYLHVNKNSRASQVVVTNYVNALLRAGQVKR